MSFVVVVGTRPEIIKMAPVVRELERRNVGFVFIHTGQHFDYEPGVFGGAWLAEAS
jgi:UDP-N-acetylglucosamine 2-epimerase (non-hydrolysing)